MVQLMNERAWAHTSPTAQWHAPTCIDEPERAQPVHHPAPTVTQPLCTFIVEDSAVIRDRLIATLEDILPIKVVGTADSERAAVAWLNESGNNCDLLILDIFLRQGTGLGVLQYLAAKAAKAAKAVQTASSAPAESTRPKIVVLTNYATAAVRARCLALGADVVFDKSQDIEALLAFCANLSLNPDADSATSGH